MTQTEIIIPDDIDPQMIALGIRQPWIELILRGVKTIEVRSQHTNIRGTILLYASQKMATFPVAMKAAQRRGIDAETLPRGLLLGTVELVDSVPCRRSESAASCVPPTMLAGKHGWKLKNPQRFEQPVPVRYLPYGVWFYPFMRQNKNDGKSEK